jgi:glycogen synthase
VVAFAFLLLCWYASCCSLVITVIFLLHLHNSFTYVLQVGGLGDVVTGLCKALQKRGHLVEIVLPKYDCMQYDRIHNLRVC